MNLSEVQVNKAEFLGTESVIDNGDHKEKQLLKLCDFSSVSPNMPGDMWQQGAVLPYSQISCRF